MNKVYTAILIDDEKHALRTLSAQLEWTKLPIIILDTASSVEEGSALLRAKKPDFLFLDIKMPSEDGFELFPKIDLTATDVIMTTAHEEYALKAFQHYASGYLMKPIITKELRALLSKLIGKKREGNEQKEYLIIEQKNGVLNVPTDSILYVSTQSGLNYIHLENGSMKMVSVRLKNLEEKLKRSHFFRIHHQYLVNTQKVVEILKARNAEVVLENNLRLPISRAKKKEFYVLFENYRSESRPLGR